MRDGEALNVLGGSLLDLFLLGVVLQCLLWI